MKRILILSCAILIFAVGVCFSEAPEKTKSLTIATRDRIFVKIINGDASLFANGTPYLISDNSIVLPMSLLYFAAKDFTTNQELLIKKTEKALFTLDTPERKIVKLSFLVGSNKVEDDINPNYRLEIFAEVRKGFPLIAIYSKFVYLGKGTHKCGVNWGLSSYSEEDPFKYYTVPDKNGKAVTYKLVPASKLKKNKIGYAEWLYLHDGKGDGIVLICPSMLGKGGDFIFINTVPPQKDLQQNSSADVFMIFFPVNNNFNEIPTIYENIKKMKWDFK